MTDPVMTEPVSEPIEAAPTPRRPIKGLGVLAAIVILLCVGAVVAFLKQQPVQEPQIIAIAPPEAAPKPALLPLVQDTWRDATTQISNLLPQSAPPAVAPATPSATAPATSQTALDNSALWAAVQHIDTKMPTLVAWRATQNLSVDAYWWQRAWASIASRVVYKPAAPTAEDTSIEAVLVRLQQALIQRNKALYAAALSQLRPAERALLEPLPHPDAITAPTTGETP